MSTDLRAIPGFLSALRKFFEEYAKEDPRPDMLSFPNDEWSMFSLNAASFIYRRKETADALDKFRKKFERKEWTAKWSDNYINSFTNKITEEAYFLADDARLTTLFEEAFQALDAEPQQFISILPVAGLYLGGYEFELRNVKLQTINAAQLAAIRQKFADIIATTLHTAEEKIQFNQRAVDGTELLLNRPCAFITVAGDKDRAKSTAEQDVENVLDFIQFAALTLDRSFKKLHISIGGDLRAEQPGRLLMAVDGTSIHDEHDMLYAHRFEFNAEGMEKLRKYGFSPLINALGKPGAGRTKFESLLINSMHWIADADQQSQFENKVTSYVTAIDLFFATKGEPLTRDVTEGTAVVLGKDLVNRRKIVKRMSEFYDMRSGVSHAGEAAIDDASIAELRFLALNFLAEMCRQSMRFSTKQEFRSWMADRRLDPVPEPEAQPTTASAKQTNTQPAVEETGASAPAATSSGANADAPQSKGG
jgi:hypothetical protein